MPRTAFSPRLETRTPVEFYHTRVFALGGVSAEARCLLQTTGTALGGTPTVHKVPTAQVSNQVS